MSKNRATKFCGHPCYAKDFSHNMAAEHIEVFHCIISNILQGRRLFHHIFCQVEKKEVIASQCNPGVVTAVQCSLNLTASRFRRKVLIQDWPQFQLSDMSGHLACNPLHDAGKLRSKRDSLRHIVYSPPFCLENNYRSH